MMPCASEFLNVFFSLDFAAYPITDENKVSRKEKRNPKLQQHVLLGVAWVVLQN
jgi:hypothetical protein